MKMNSFNQKLEQPTNALGKIHSLETLGTQDGPGLRTVIFFSGCPLRCIYCHNIDVAVGKKFTEISVDDLLEKVKKNLPYLKNNGGVTISGGEPFFQPVFLLKFLQACKNLQIHTAVDTSLFTNWKNIQAAIPYTDLFLISIKQLNPEKHRKLTSRDSKIIQENLLKLSKVKARIWLRYVVIPSLTDSDTDLKNLNKFLSKINFEQIELLPYHLWGASKWEKMGLKYAIPEISPPNIEVVKKFSRSLKKAGYKVLVHSQI